jgi:predicted ATPase
MGNNNYMHIQEKLIIKDFFSIKDFEWDIKGFNILTGGMGSGKSLALKLLYFCEQIFHQVVFSDPSFSKATFNQENFFNSVAVKFERIFSSKNRQADFSNTKIKYEYILLNDKEQDALNDAQYLPFDQPDQRFDLSAEWNTEQNKFAWSSNYILACLAKWQKLFDVPKTPDLLDNVRNHVYDLILSSFSHCFPLAAMFIPASRAIAAIADTISSRDQFIMEFFKLKGFALSFDGISNNIVNNILRVKEITLNEKKEPVFELIDGRRISALELSSGQQELLYLLLLINDIQGTTFIFGKSISVFIEEPSAHLFPKEQKETIEFLAHYFNLLQNKKEYEPGHRFFISTHSPYILNAINNILEKKRLIKKVDKIKDPEARKEKKEKLEALFFPDLSIDNVSAYMIEENGCAKSMIDGHDDDKYIYSVVIDQIADVISNDSDKLLNLNDEIKNPRGRAAGYFFL